jgi:hypothetical protein
MAKKSPASRAGVKRASIQKTVLQDEENDYIKLVRKKLWLGQNGATHATPVVNNLCICCHSSC